MSSRSSGASEGAELMEKLPGATESALLRHHEKNGDGNSGNGME